MIDNLFGWTSHRKQATSVKKKKNVSGSFSILSIIYYLNYSFVFSISHYASDSSVNGKHTVTDTEDLKNLLLLYFLVDLDRFQPDL